MKDALDRGIYSISIGERKPFIMSVGYDDSPRTGTIELDSHADTFVGGSNCVMLPDTETGDKATVYSFSDESRPFREIPIGSLATAWVDPKTSETVILVFNEGLYFGDRLNHSLLCPNQLRAHGVEVKDAPKHLDNESSHAIYSDQDDLTIPLRLRGVISLFDTHKPTDEELENCRHVHLTSDQPWDPYDPSFEQQERAVQHKQSRGISTILQHGDDPIDTGEACLTRLSGTRARVPDIGEVLASDDNNGNDIDSFDFIDPFLKRVETYSPDLLDHVPEEQFVELLPEDELTQRFASAVNISYSDCAKHSFASYNTGSGDFELIDVPISEIERELAPVVYDRSPAMTKELLSERWGIGLNTAHRTLRTTTQRGVRTRLHPSDRRIPTRQPHLAFPTIKKKMYTDTSFAKVKSVRQNTCAQDWTDGQGYTLFYPLRSKSEAHTTVSRMVHDMNAIPQIIVSDGAKEEGSQKWNAEIRLIRSRHHVTEPYSQWQNRAEADIREIKKMIRKFTRRKGSPRRLWDFLGEYVAALRRKTAHDFPELDGRTPEENVHGRVVDISAYCQFEWYENVWYIDRTDSNVLCF